MLLRNLRPRAARTGAGVPREVSGGREGVRPYTDRVGLIAAAEQVVESVLQEHGFDALSYGLAQK
jgi:hypothetical protein